MSAGRPDEDYRFDLLEPLGSGTLGERFRAVEMATGDEVVFTRLHRHWTRGWPSEEPFLRTVERMCAVRSLSVATTFAGGVDGEGWWLTTEDVRGTRLDRLIPDGGPMPERQVLRLAHQMAAGLAVLHRHSLPHGALEPGAVLLTEEGRVALTEHGLLPLLARGAARFGNLPAGHTLRGDPAYMSPEVVSDGGRGRPWDDVYSLGLVLLYASTGDRPYGDLDMLATAARVLRDVSPVEARLPARSRKLINRCLRPPFYRPDAARVAARAGRPRGRSRLRTRRAGSDRTGRPAPPGPHAGAAPASPPAEPAHTAQPARASAPGRPAASLPALGPGPGPASRDPDPRPSRPGGADSPEPPVVYRPAIGPALTVSDDGEAVPGRRSWIFMTGGMIDASPVLMRGLVLVTSLDGVLYALDAATGRLRWRYETDDMIESGPAPHGDVVYLGGRDGVLRALDPADGTLLRSRRVGDMLGSTPAVDGDSLCVGTGDGDLVVLEHDLRVRHRAAAHDIVDSSPALAGGRAYAGTSGGVLAVDRATGKARVWAVGDTGGCDPAAADGTVHIGTAAGDVLALDAGTGRVRWSLGTGGPPVGRPAVSGGVVYAGSRDRCLYAIKAASGRVLWRLPTGGPVTGGATVRGDSVYLGSRDGRLYRVARATGSVGWRFDAGGWINRCAPAAGDGLVYAGTAGGHLHAVDLRTGQGIAAPPPELDVRLEL
ncbi:PQQ-binding-like beta-propeller repeat protein [Actinomadura madurae]|uniref:outer membrane protein assembly factor BamB family protein n=1 Tax=Actinomadura madurae TaxID=1993 RepID=UPI000D87C7AA|nr:PQQ-binding-like beta-propeller repeat protein [Actinomadura madurae]SPT60885.1 Serine/threonine-protein kinase AfsK [Actinomadura madurae]